MLYFFYIYVTVAKTEKNRTLDNGFKAVKRIDFILYPYQSNFGCSNNFIDDDCALIYAFQKQGTFDNSTEFHFSGAVLFLYFHMY